MKQISIITQSASGMLSKVADLMAENNINITNIEAESIAETGIVVMCVDQYDLALQILRDAGLKAISEESLLVRLKDEPGGLAKIANRFSKAGINIRGIHIVKRDGDNSIAAISTERTEEALQLVKDILVS